MEVITVDQWPAPESRDYRPELEAGDVILFPTTPFALSETSKEFLRSLDFWAGPFTKTLLTGRRSIGSLELTQRASKWRPSTMFFRSIHVM